MLSSQLGYYSIWPFFASVFIILLVACLPVLKVADIPPIQSENRLWNMDGLRGFLALAVVFHHVAIYHRFLTDGTWAAPPTRFYSALGPIGVSTFFMITGYLFWSALLRQGGNPDWMKLYIGRIFRIGPLYLVAVIVVIFWVFLSTHFSLHVHKLQLLSELLQWLSLGLLANPDLNGYKNTYQLLAGVTWSIQWEWGFYCALPLIAFIAKKRRNDLIFIVPGIILCMIRRATHLTTSFNPSATMVGLFLLGMLCASLQKRELLSRLSDHVNSALVLFLLGAVFAFDDSYQCVPMLLLGGMFYLICSGSTLFGLLLSRPARRLGDVSYGIYLLQGLFLSGIYHMKGVHFLAIHSAAYHWLFGLAGTVLLVFTAAITHITIEIPGIRAGKQLAAKVALYQSHRVRSSQQMLEN